MLWQDRLEEGIKESRTGIKSGRCYQSRRESDIGIDTH